MTRLLARCVVPVVVAATLTAGCSGGRPPRVAAVVEGIPIASTETQSLLHAYMHSPAADKEATSKTLVKFVLLYQIRLAYLHHLAEQAGIDPRPDPNDALTTQLPLRAFQLAGLRPSDLTRSIEAGRLSKAMAEKLFPNVSVSDADLRREYDRRGALNGSSWRITAKVAEFTSADPARQLGSRVQRGEPFEQAATELGTLQAGTVDITPVSPLPRPVLDAVGKLPLAEVSAPIQVSANGWVSVLVEHREELPHLSFDQVRGELTSYLADQQRQALFQEWFDKKLHSARISVSRHYGRWDVQEGTVR